ncbi:Multisubunit Na+/H+ antiporter, MnhF subunit [Actinacidiphila yanglinensis]|uniref:Multisubunit Na+/H+ antiporter, MnhF subunit n=1 Tax=Actinacidiphila yanglinensis TaxID=310779 RepID=A0A1H6DFY8_9ACTN|nr:MrpF/PhaF family protein [Actinacidiphila yanglinensis]SEG84130.1 Multisubunit Na+/H+ antiporter, MnhF subunit [Actinacidiphila yanglinensis]
MNAWEAAALVLLAAGGPVCLWGVARGSAVRRLTALSLLSTVVGAVFMVLPQAYARPSYQDLALVLAVLSPAGTLVFTRFVAGRPYDSEGPERESVRETS